MSEGIEILLAKANPSDVRLMHLAIEGQGCFVDKNKQSGIADFM